ncbi:YfgM family protein [Megalodesulfovibrio gigas]|nr:tetratricopeptide repeat protein [Megalodesulfovibrio gigas]
MAESSRTPSSAAASTPETSQRPGSTLISFEEAGIPREHPALVWIQNNLKMLGVVIAVIILAAAAMSLAKWNKETARKQAAEVLGSLLVNAKGETAAAELEAFAQAAPEPVRTGAMLSLAELLMASEEYAKAADVWAGIALKASQPMKTTAGIGQAQALVLAGKAQEALALVRTLEQGAPASFEKSLLRLKAQAAEAAGEYQDAIAAWATMMEKESSQQTAFYRQVMARLELLKAEKKSS